jgi:hypothetical protein
MHASDFLALPWRHLLSLFAVRKWSRNRSVNRFLEVPLSFVTDKFDAAGVVEIAKMVGNDRCLLADHLRDVRGAELSLVEDEERFLPDAMVQRVGRRFLR